MTENVDSPGRSSRPPDVQKRIRRRFLVVWGLLLAGTILLFRGVLGPFSLGLVVAYVLAPVVARLEQVRVAGRAIPRWLAVLLVYAALVSSLATVVTLGAPRLVEEIGVLARDVPKVVRLVRREWLPRVAHHLRGVPAEEPPAPAPAPASTAGPGVGLRIEPLPGGGYEVRLPPEGLVLEQDGDRTYVRPSGAPSVAHRLPADPVEGLLTALTESTGRNASALLSALQRLARAIVGGVFTFFVMLMLSAYLLVSKDAILDFLRALVRPDRKDDLARLLHRIDRGLAGVVRGQLIICLVNGSLTAAGFYALGLPYWQILSLVATVFSIIPIFGTILSSVPAILVGLDQSVTMALLVLGWITVIHQLEANLLNPKIMGDAAKVNPVLVVFALLAGEHLFGFMGALLGVPVLSIAQSFFLHYREIALGVPAPELPRQERISWRP
ncbi:MAG: AI-2E family transporter [Polyangiales bacterium]